MDYPLLFQASNLPAPVLPLFGLNLLLSVIIALLFGKQRKIGFWGSLVVCMATSAVIGLAITLLFITRQQREREAVLQDRLSDPASMEDDMLRLQLLKEAGTISKREYESEVKRLTDK